MFGYVPCFRDFDVCSICSGDSRVAKSGGFAPRGRSPRIRGLRAIKLRFQILLDFVG